MSKPPTIMLQSASLAKILDADPVLAGQLREHLPTERLLELLGLPEDEVLAYFDYSVEEDKDAGDRWTKVIRLKR